MPYRHLKLCIPTLQRPRLPSHAKTASTAFSPGGGARSSCVMAGNCRHRGGRLLVRRPLADAPNNVSYTSRMQMKQDNLGSLAVFITSIAIFIVAGMPWALRFTAAIGLFGCVEAIRSRRVGIGFEGDEPTYFVRGNVAVTISGAAMPFLVHSGISRKNSPIVLVSGGLTRGRTRRGPASARRPSRLVKSKPARRRAACIARLTCRQAVRRVGFGTRALAARVNLWTVVRTGRGRVLLRPHRICYRHDV